MGTKGVAMAIDNSSRAGSGGLAIARLASAELVGAGGFALHSAAFINGEALDPSFTADEEDAVAPPLEWTTPPEGAMELALVVEDPDVSAAEPACHWLVWGLAPQQGQLLEGEAPPRVGKNSQRNSEWLLPRVPQGESHSYVFQLFALDAPLALMPGSDRTALLEAMQGHVVGVALLTATYAGSDDEDEGEWGDVDVDEIDWDGKD
jgi:Raf kinase inhibitor-like YbhB/YbcL family protein